ncbi:Transcription factor SKN7 [Yarrowia sp. B02]|nr:Transcription factor SKN7 [Yarrowia sp. B02]
MEDDKTATTPPTEFVWKLYMMLEEGNDNTVFWTPDGRSFVISDTIEFSKTTLPRHFRHKNFSSFVRQLNKYDFHKVKSTNDDGEPVYGENGWEFKHPNFLQFDTSGIDSIRRKLPEKRRSDGPAGYRELEDELRDLKRKHESLQKHFTSLSEDFSNAIGKLSGLQESLKKKEETMNHVFSMLAEFEYRFERLGMSQDDTASFDHIKRRRTDPAAQAAAQQAAPPAANYDEHLWPSTSHSWLPLHPPQVRRDSNGKAHADGHAETAEPAEIHQNGEVQKILIASDDADCVKVCSALLQKAGQVVEVIPDGVDAVEFLQTSASHVGLVLMETVLPRLDGCSAVELIRSMNRQVPIIMINDGSVNPKLEFLLQSCYINEVLARPFNKDEFFKAVSPHVSLSY